ncbi:MAG: response regulator [Cyclobacteriaceae bacterium]
MLKLLQRLFLKPEKESLSSIGEREIQEFLEYFDQPKFKENFSDSLEIRLESFRKLNSQEKIRTLPGVYLLLEKSYTGNRKNQQQVKLELRALIKKLFPNLCNHSGFKIIFLNKHEQQKMLATLLVSLVWEKATPIIGTSKNEILKNYEYQISKVFELQRFGHIDLSEAASTIKYELLQIFNVLTEVVGKNKCVSWFQDSYETLMDNYKFLDTFSFVIAILPDSLLNEQQLNLLSRAQIEQALVERAEKIEKVNKRLSQEISEKQKAQKSIEQHADRLNKIIENALEAVVIMNTDGRVTFWNNQAEEVFGWSSHEVMGEKLGDLIVPKRETGDYKMGIQWDNLEKKSDFLNRRLEEIGLTKDGREIPIELSMVASSIEDEVIFTSFIRDISERKRYEQELMDAKNSAEKASKTKAEFLSTMSHEIRTPMNGIFGTLELLLSENPREDQMESLEIMKHSTESLLVILNDILDYSKIEEGHVEFDKRAFSLEELSKRVIGIYSQRAEEKGIKLTLESDTTVSDMVIGDPVRLSQILNNLVSNAVKFTYEGEVKLITKVIAQEEGEAICYFQVVDTGIGISDQNLNRIFNRFIQVQNEKDKEFHTGTGLGLAISKKLLSLQGSDLHVISKLGEGSRFLFKIKLKLPDSIGKDEPALTKRIKNLNGLRVLLVEDNKINQIVASKFLKKWNCEVTIANNGKEAVKSSQAATFDLILMDLQMPVMDGFEASEEIRSMDVNGSKNVPIIALTADVFPEVKERVLSSGMNDFMTKPFDPEKLYFTITSNLASKE